jgi:hypothetical protein
MSQDQRCADASVGLSGRDNLFSDPRLPHDG